MLLIKMKTLTVCIYIHCKMVLHTQLFFLDKAYILNKMLYKQPVGIMVQDIPIGVCSLGFVSQAGHIGHNVTHSSPPLQWGPAKTCRSTKTAHTNELGAQGLLGAQVSYY